jgi:hypothetical protein
MIRDMTTRIFSPWHLTWVLFLLKIRSSLPENIAINYMPTTNVPKIDSIKTITIKTKSNKPSIILSNMVSSIITNPDVS